MKTAVTFTLTMGLLLFGIWLLGAAFSAATGQAFVFIGGLLWHRPRLDDPVAHPPVPRTTLALRRENPPVRRATLTRTYQSPTGTPIQLRRGDHVHVGSSDHPRPGFEFVLTVDGHGWVPTRHLTNDRPTAVIRFAYDTTELDATTGDRVAVIVDDPHVGQAWCRTPDGREGWLPRDILD